MLFNSWKFAAFMIVVGIAYALLQRRLRVQNAMLLVASYYFYGCWDYRFLALLMFSTCVDFVVAHRIDASEGAARKRWLGVSLGVNLSILGFFKYFGFFVQSLSDLLAAVGIHVSLPVLHVVLPMGISFYTFQALAYTIDVYRGQTKPCRSFLDFALYSCFFPQLVAGPIERPNHLMPQISSPRRPTWTDMDVGIGLLIQGLFKKIVIADNLAEIANPIFDNPRAHEPADLVCAALAFTFQIYGDFSGYSDMARGVARLLGFDVTLNFKVPYASRSPSEFWQRWHVSLSAWLRDYVYISLGGNRGSGFTTARNLMLTMLLGGLWHGASWHFVAWGAYHGALLVIYRLLGRYFRWVPKMPGAVAAWLLMSVLTVEGWILFRAETMSDVWYMTTHLGFAFGEHTASKFSELLFFALPLVLLDLYVWFKSDLLAWVRLPLGVRELAYLTAICLMILFAVRTPTEFIYFQF